MSKRVCTEPGCPRLTDGGRCAEHKRQQDRARGTRQQRGYDAEHDRLRQTIAATVVGRPCARCRRPIEAGQSWHLDHTDDRTGYLGPSHEACNTSAGGRAAHPA